MPIKRFPKPFVELLRQESARIESLHGEMENIDPRQMRRWGIAKNETKTWGFRVRRMDVSKYFPQVVKKYPWIKNVVIKRSQGRFVSAEQEIKIVREIVREHNANFHPTAYKIIPPIAYALNKKLILMAETKKPTVEEIFDEKTEHGMKMLWHLQKRHGIDASRLRKLCQIACKRTETSEHNMLVLGAKNGQIIFMPLVDLY
ncbi:MAG: hypothetical protein Q7S21_06085 [archaeon]|nr:hypothetical protein [archaeon]